MMRRAPGSTLKPALAVSVLLHLGLGALFLQRPFAPLPDASRSATAPALQVTLTTPRLRSPVAVPVPKEDPVPAGDHEAAPGSLSEPEAAVPVVVVSASSAILADERSLNGRPSNSQNAVPDAPLAPELDAVQLQASMAAFVSKRRDSLIQDWVQDCRRFRRPDDRGPPCPDEDAGDTAVNAEQRASMDALFRAQFTRESDIARLSRQLEDESQHLGTLVDDQTVLGAMARQRYAALKVEYCIYNKDKVACSGPQTMGPEGEVITLISVGSGN